LIQWLFLLQQKHKILLIFPCNRQLNDAFD
jgi:hypothetical protein